MLVLIIKILLFVVLISRLIYLQIFSFSKYKNLAYRNKIKLIPVIPERGNIWDKNQILLASNNKTYRLLLNRGKYLTNKNILREIQELLSLDDDFFVNSIKKIKEVSNKSYANLIPNLTWEQIFKIEQNLEILDGVMIDIYHLRIYHQNLLTCHIVGYVKLTKTKNFDLVDKNVFQNDNYLEDLSVEFDHDNSNFDQNNYKNMEIDNDLNHDNNLDSNLTENLTEIEKSNNLGLIVLETGNYGIEKQYNQYLTGKVGYIEIETDAIGKYVKQLNFSKAEIGQDLHLYLDINLQKILLEELPDNSCAIINNLEDNSILGMMSKPIFDPKTLSNPLNHQTWQEIQTSGSLINRCIQGQYNPGSVFKLVTIMSALENGIDPNFAHTCTSDAFLDKYFHCWNRSGHGKIKCMADAIATSCNHYMFKIAKFLSIEQILATAHKFGFGQLTNIDLPYEKKGSIFYKHNKLSNLLMLSIGQGFVTATPIQALRLISTIFNDGNYQPFRCAKSTMPNDHLNIISQENFDKKKLEILKLGMYRVLNSFQGNSYKNRPKEFILSGKTSTIQVVSRDKYSNKNKNHGMFAGYTTFNGKKYGVTVFIERGEYGQNALKVANKILTRYFCDIKTI